MMVSPNIFRSYDIRGICPAELDDKTAHLIGRAFAKYAKAKKIAIGRDMRLSSPAIFAAVSKGIIETGCDVFDLGQVPTEIIYFAVGKNKYDAGIMITASHNPKGYNGFKLIKKDNSNFSMVRGKDLYPKLNVSIVNPKNAGKVEALDLKKDYISYVFSKFNSKSIKTFKVVIDAGNGMAATLIPLIEKNLPIKIVPLNFNIDGNFPGHPSNPLEDGATDELSRATIREKADFGFIFDGDADRIFLMDEKGNLVRSDITILLLAKYFLEKKSGATIVYNTICSKAVPEFIKKWGGKAFKTPVGFVNVREGLIKSNGVMGGEMSGHYCFKDNFYGDSSLITFLILLNVISGSSKKVSDLAKELSVYPKLAEINFEVKNKEAIIAKVKEKYSDAKQEYLDGVTVDYDNWWFNLRPSNTEPLLRLTIEAKTPKLLEEKRTEIISFIKNQQ